MTKSELVDSLASASGLPKSAVNTVLAALVASITHALQHDQTVGLPGLGQFERQFRPARKARDIRSGAELDVPAKYAPRFRAAKALKDAMPTPKKGATR